MSRGQGILATILARKAGDTPHLDSEHMTAGEQNKTSVNR